jgi:hypothetical protein
MGKSSLIIVFVICAVLSLPVKAGNIAVFQPGYWFNYPEDTTNSTVDGVKLGLPICSGYGSVEGMELSFFCSATDEVSGLQWSLLGVNICKKLHGTQLGLFNATSNKAEGSQIGAMNIAEHIAGTQLGLINYAKHGLQLGLININEDGWLPVCILFNFSVK